MAELLYNVAVYGRAVDVGADCGRAGGSLPPQGSAHFRQRGAQVVLSAASPAAVPTAASTAVTTAGASAQGTDTGDTGGTHWQ